MNHRHARRTLLFEPGVEGVGDPAGESGTSSAWATIGANRLTANPRSAATIAPRSPTSRISTRLVIEVTCHIVVEDPVVERAGKALLPA